MKEKAIPRVALHKDVKFKDFVISQNDWIVGKFKSYGGIAKWQNQSLRD